MNIRFVIFWCAVLSLATGCIEDVSGSFEGDDVLVVNCVLRDADVQHCWLSFLDDESDARVSQAVVSLIDLDEGRTMRFSHEAGGFYEVDCQPQGGHRYRLEIDVPEYEHVYAETVFPEIPVIYFRGEISNILRFRFGEAIGPVCLWMSARDRSGEPFPYIATTCYAADDFNLSDCLVSDLVEYDDSRMSKILSSPVNEFISREQERNMKEGDYVYPDKSIVMSVADRLMSSYFHDRFVRIPVPGDYDNGLYRNVCRDFSVVFPGKGWSWNMNFQTEVVSEEYDLYLRDALKEGMKDYTDLHVIYDRSNPYSNICHGTGIFGAHRVKEEYESTVFQVSKEVYYASY